MAPDSPGLSDVPLTMKIKMEAGSETSSMMAHFFVLTMMAHPEIFKKAQQEVDRICGTSASPSIEHIDKLPYLQAIMMEVSALKATGNFTLRD